MQRIKFLDGFRAIAVLLVILFHMGILEFGFAGVELFFVISGFIISLLLIREFRDTDKIDIKKFFIRRVSRIYPPLIICILVTLFLLVNFPIVSIQDTVFSQALFSSVGLANIYELIHNTGYWEQGIKSPLLHLWSIGVEMQFYLFWPFLMSFFFRKNPDESINRKRLLVLLVMLFLITVGTTFFLSLNYYFDYLYYNPLTRISSFILGSIISVLVFNKEVENKKRNYLFISLTLFGLAYLTYGFQLNDINLFRGYITLYSMVFGLSIYLLTVTRFKVVDFLLENKLVLYIGKISYSLYLIHMPVIVFLSSKNLFSWFGINFVDTPIKLSAIQLTASLILASIINILVERRIKLKNGYIAMFTVVIFSTLTFWLQGDPAIIYRFTDEESQQIDEKWTNLAPHITEYGGEAILVVGDSWSRRIAFGMALVQEVNESYPYKILAYGVNNGSVMDSDYFYNWDDPEQYIPNYKTFEGYLKHWQDAIDTYQPSKVVLVFGTGDEALQVIDGEELRVGNQKFDERFIEQYQKVIDYFYEQDIEIYMTNVVNLAHTLDEIELNQYSDAMNKNIAEIAENNKGKITFLDLNNYLGDQNNLSPYIIRGIYMYDETNHTSYEGSLYVGKWIFGELNK